MARKALNTSYDWRFSGGGLPGFGALIETNAQKVEDNFVELFALPGAPGGRVALDVAASWYENAAAITANLDALATAFTAEIDPVDDLVDFLYTGAGVPGASLQDANAAVLEAAFVALYEASAWTFAGNTYLSSDGASGSYADAATTAAARVCFTGTGKPTFTFAAWYRTNNIAGAMFCASDDGAPSAVIWAAADTASTVDIYGELKDAGGANVLGVESFPDASSFIHIALVADGADAKVYINGVETDTATLATTYANVDALTLFADYAHANRLAGDIRSPAVWNRALAANEVAALHTAGAAHDLREDVGNYTGGGPEHWWPGDGDSGTTVTDRGSVGTCALTLHGGVTIEEV